MWHSEGQGGRRAGKNGLVAVAIGNDKGSPNSFKWTLDNLLTKGQTVVLIHVFSQTSAFSTSHGAGFDASGKIQLEKLAKDLFLPFRCYGTRKDIQCFEVVLEGNDMVKAITEYVAHAAIETLVLGTSTKNGFIRKFKADLSTSVSKAAPDFCTVYIICKGKVSAVRSASRAAPFSSPLLNQIQNQQKAKDNSSEIRRNNSMVFRDTQPVKPRVSIDESFRSPFGRTGRGHNIKSFADFMEAEADISFVSSGRPSTDRSSSVGFDLTDPGPTPRFSTSSETSLGSLRSGWKVPPLSPSSHDFSSFSQESGGTSFSGSSQQNMDEMEIEMRRLKLELKKTMDMYSRACKEAITAKQKAVELNHWRTEEEQRFEEARYSEEAARMLAEKEKARYQEALEAAEGARKLAELEASKRLNIEMKALRDAEEMKKVMDSLKQNDIRYRRYTIQEIESATQFFSQSKKIGEGGYGPVFKCYLHHTPVAVKVLRPDAAQGRIQFQREVEVLSSIRHPNMVLLLGACPEYGILVYEYMAKGSLDDCLFRVGNTPALPWQIRFRIAAEIATGLLFLHEAKPEPFVHRDLKPGNILLDNNYTSKISDVGLARLVPNVAENVTQCQVTSAAGTFCYIDPEYQQTGMLGVKSDIYSLGIMLLQVITARPPMGLTHYVELAIEKGTFAEILDPTVPDWPVDEALCFAKLALQCAELRRKDRPDLGDVILPELNRLRDLSEESASQVFFTHFAGASPLNSIASTRQEVISDPQVAFSGSVMSQSSTSSLALIESTEEG